LRMITSSTSLELDEAEQLVTTQKWALGYGSQPPLYTWLQIGFFKLFGTSVLSLSILKNLLLFALYLFVYHTGRLVTGNLLGAQAAAASLLFFPEIAWQSQIDRTHSVLALVLVCGTLYLFLKIAEEGRTLHFALLGLCGGLGLLSKYNTSFFLIALLAAAASIPRYRSIVLDRRMLLAAGVLLAVFLPNALWMLRNPELALLTSFKFKIAESRRLVNVQGVLRMFGALLSMLAPMVLLHCLLFVRRRRKALSWSGDERLALLVRTAACVLLLFAVAVLLSGATNIRERWLLPALIFAPVISVSLFRRHIDRQSMSRVYALAAAIMVVVSVGHPARVVLAEKWNRTERLNIPYRSLASQLEAPLSGVGLVITDTTPIAGNLRLNLPGKSYSPHHLAVMLAPEAERFALVWDASRRDAPPDRVLKYLRQMGVELPPSEVRYVSSVQRFHQTKPVRVGYALVRKQGAGWPLPQQVQPEGM
ncbi:MAG TPA: glycosyltransferase family 39 protein, partial [Verrucomicrobiae bacterium]|nr:glycosyltransferase family 39 protein [Verrucomicrobiae bacterium]